MNATELTTFVTSMKQNLENQKEQLNRLEADPRASNALQQQLVTDNALLKREIEELKKTKDLWGTRLFGIIMLIVGVVLTYLVRR